MATYLPGTASHLRDRGPTSTECEEPPGKKTSWALGVEHADTHCLGPAQGVTMV